jgi:hypothetical protein
VARHLPITSIIRPSMSWLDSCGLWLLGRKELAEFLAVRLPQVQYLHNSGRIPQPIRFDFGPPRYSVPELRDWVRMGCPPIGDWIKLRGLSGNIPKYEWGSPLRTLDFSSRVVARCVEPRD